MSERIYSSTHRQMREEREAMVKYRLFFGTLMTVLFTAMVLFDGWLDGSLTVSTADDKSVRGTILGILIVVLTILAQLELSKLVAARNLKAFTPVSITASALLVCTWYWPQFEAVSAPLYVFFLFAFTLLGLLLSQYICCGTSAVLANCGANCFSIIYLGLLGGFALAIRIDFGLWPVLMFVFVVKSSDIGAYAIGTLFGKHKFSPKISPSKTWEGTSAGVATAMVVALAFAAGFDIMSWWLAVIFGLCLALAGLMGDLVESMIKRDAEQKDSANKVPGFGGILDIIDSPLVAAPFAYLFFMLSTERIA
jgi:phosphatidate cytidylyltransferase